SRALYGEGWRAWQDATGRRLIRYGEATRSPAMIARGSSDEDLARRHIARLQGLIAHWNEDADTFRRVARGQAAAAPWMLEEADRTHLAIREDAELCDTL